MLCLSDGNIEFVSDGADGSPLAYIRSSADEKILVVVIQPIARQF